jgi:cell division protein ZapE
LFLKKVGTTAELQHNLLINRRYIKAYRVSGNVVWFDFKVICGRPRSSLDYIELANRYRSLFISNIPLLDEGNDDMAYRFIQLIDELYDRHIKIAISAALPPQQLYQGRQYQFEFVRTISRLEEMRQAAM